VSGKKCRATARKDKKPKANQAQEPRRRTATKNLDMRAGQKKMELEKEIN
jgi:hypothetical protein